MNELQNIDTQELAKQLVEGTAEVVECKPSNKGKLITGGIALCGMIGTGILGFFVGKKHEKKKWESYDEEDDYDDDEFEEYEDFNEVEEPTDTKEQPEKKADDKAEEK